MGKEFFGLLGKSKGDREHMKKEGIEKKFLKLFERKDVIKYFLNNMIQSKTMPTVSCTK